jgi:hypothetical protein
MTSLLSTELSPSLCWVPDELQRADLSKMVPFECTLQPIVPAAASISANTLRRSLAA